MKFEQPNVEPSTMSPFADQIGYYMVNGCMFPALNGHSLPCVITPLIREVDVQPSDINCPRKYVVFDQNLDRSQFMFNPEINCHRKYVSFEQNNATDEKDNSCSFEEDSDEIDALLSIEYEDYEDDNDDVVSTARTSADYALDSQDSCSNYKSTMPSREMFSKEKPVGDQRDDKKRRRIRKMVKALQGIVPGANHMSPICVLDEAVRYLKSVRVEVKKLGV